MNKLVMFSMKGCANCDAAANVLISKGVGFVIKKVDEDADAFDVMNGLGLRSLPQFFLYDGQAYVYAFDHKSLTKLTDEQWEALK